MLRPLSLSIIVAFSLGSARGEDLPPTLMTKPGKLLVEQRFEKSPALFDGKSNGFASGFKGWRWNAVPRGGHWEVKDGTFTGAEDPAMKHPATASYGFDFQDVVITAEVRMNDVPADGRPARFIMVRSTDTKDYVCSVILNPTGFRIQKDDNDHGGPDKAVPLGEVKMPLSLNAWHQVVFEIQGKEMVGTVDGKSLTGSHPLISSEKHSVMFVCGTEGSVRNFRVWAAEPNPEWKSNREKLQKTN